MNIYRLAVIDDDASWCFVVATRLQQHGYTVETFTDPNTFLQEAENFDLALIDFSMPSRRYQVNIDGPDLIHTLKQRLQQPPLLVLISAYFTDDLLQYASELCPEADACLGKTMDSTRMLQQIEQLLKTRKPLNRQRNISSNLVNPPKIYQASTENR